MDKAEFRRCVKAEFPHISVKVRTVHFDGDPRQCLTITGEKHIAEVRAVNEWARQAHILRDSNVRACKPDGSICYA